MQEKLKRKIEYLREKNKFGAGRVKIFLVTRISGNKSSSFFFCLISREKQSR